MVRNMGEDGNKKGKGCLIGILSSLVLPLLIVLIIASGIMAAADFVKDMTDKVGDFFTGGDVIKQVSDPNAVTDEDLESWMISRQSMTYLLQAVEKFNNRDLEKITLNLECRNEWKESEPTPTPTPTPTPAPTPTTNPKASPTPTGKAKPSPTVAPTPTEVPFVPRIIDHDDTDSVRISVSEDQTLVDKYKVYWQLVYMMCVYRYMEADDTEALVQTVTPLEIDWMLEELKPKFTYGFNPAVTWKGVKRTLTRSEITEHPYKKLKQAVQTSQERVVNSVFNYTWWIPKFQIQKVEFAYGTDVYSYRYVWINGEEVEYCTVNRTYDKEKFLKILSLYGGTTDLFGFVSALEFIPGTESLVSDLENLLGD